MRALIIAEAGVNHGGDIDRAFRLCAAAKMAGADVVKFQTWAKGTVTPELDELRLTDNETFRVAMECRSLGIEFCSTPDDIQSLNFLVTACGVKRIKLGSGSLLYRPLVDAAVATGLPILLSTGMATLGEVRFVVSRYDPRTPFTLMHSVSLYPCPLEFANVSAISALRQLGYPVGYSDHTTHPLAAALAVALGAGTIEMHFMLEDDDQAIDEAVSLMPRAFSRMVAELRFVEALLGDGIKRPTPAEAAVISKLRKDEHGRQPGVPTQESGA